MEFREEASVHLDKLKCFLDQSSHGQSTQDFYKDMFGMAVERYVDGQTWVHHGMYTRYLLNSRQVNHYLNSEFKFFQRGGKIEGTLELGPEAVCTVFRCRTPYGVMDVGVALLSKKCRVVEPKYRITLQIEEDTGLYRLDCVRKEGAADGDEFIGVMLMCGLQCAHCATHVTMERYKFCAKCYEVLGVRVPYCNAECQRAHWPAHRCACGGVDDDGHRIEAVSMLEPLQMTSTTAAIQARFPGDRKVHLVYTDQLTIPGRHTAKQWYLFDQKVRVMFEEVYLPPRMFTEFGTRSVNLGMGRDVTVPLHGIYKCLKGGILKEYARKHQIVMCTVLTLRGTTVRVFVYVTAGGYEFVECARDADDCIRMVFRVPDGRNVSSKPGAALVVGTADDRCVVCSAPTTLVKLHNRGIRLFRCGQCAKSPSREPVFYCSHACYVRDGVHHPCYKKKGGAKVATGEEEDVE